MRTKPGITSIYIGPITSIAGPITSIAGPILDVFYSNAMIYYS
jgi:hypothetical protein